MSIDSKIDLLGDFSNNVSYLNKDYPVEITECILKLSRSHGPSLKLPKPNIHDLEKAFNFKLSQEDTGFIKCTGGNGEEYYLLNNKYAKLKIIPEVVLKGSKPDNIDGVELHIEKFSSFFHMLTRGERKFLLSFQYNSAVYSLEIVTYNYTDSLRKINIRIFKIDGDMSFGEVRSIVNEVRIFFHLLFATPVGIDNIWVISGDEHIPTYFSISLPEKGFSEGLVDTWLNWKDFEMAFKAYFENSSFEEVWRPLPNLSNGFPSFEYKALAFVSVVDKCVSTKLRLHGETQGKHNIPPSKVKELKREITEFIDVRKEQILENLKSDFPEKDGKYYNDIILGWKGEIQRLSGSANNSLKYKIKYIYGELSEEIRSIIDLSEGEIDELVDVRNDAAHNGFYGKGYNGEKIKSTVISLDKVRVFLWYFIYKDFGFNDEQFINYIDKNLYVIRNQRCFI